MNKKDIIRFPHSKTDEIKIASENLNAVINRLRELDVPKEFILNRMSSMYKGE